MLNNIIKYYEKTTDNALINLKDEKKFAFKSRLTNRNLIMQSEDHLIKTFKKAGGTDISMIRDDLEKYKNDIKKMHELAVKDYNKTLQKLKNTTDIDEKQKILNDIASRGFSGFKSKDGKIWNIETYSNMYFTQLNNNFVRIGHEQYLRENGVKKVLISNHVGSCPLCIPYEGKILTWEELENAKANGLFHVRCRHFFTRVANTSEFSD